MASHRRSRETSSDRSSTSTSTPTFHVKLLARSARDAIWPLQSPDTFCALSSPWHNLSRVLQLFPAIQHTARILLDVPLGPWSNVPRETGYVTSHEFIWVARVRCALLHVARLRG